MPSGSTISSRNAATIYSPAIFRVGDVVTVTFSDDHPGHSEPVYQQHRADIAKAALDFRLGEPVPRIAYTDAEHELWRVVTGELAALHLRLACREYLDGSARLGLPVTEVPQLGDVAQRLRDLTGFTMTPAAGLVPVRDFYGSLADRRFQATQYIRHTSYPRFSPEPDMLHEVIGHGNAMANDRFAGIYREFGRAVRRLGDEAVKLVSKVFWFCMEHGIVMEHGESKVCGASLLTSSGELSQFRRARVEPLDIEAMIRQEYRVEDYQTVLFCAESFDHLEDFLCRFLTTLDDDDEIVTERLVSRTAPAAVI